MNAAALILFAAGCNSDRPDPAMAEVSSLGLQVTVTRVATHPFLARYNLKLTVETQDGCSVSSDLFPDTGGVSRRNVYVGGSARLYVIGQFDARVFEKSTCSITLREFRSLEEGMHYVGVFDVEDNRQWSFFPAAVRREQLFERL